MPLTQLDKQEQVHPGILLLGTKMRMPPRRASVLPRQRIDVRLNEGMCARLVLISAPAGFGKSTALREWLATCQAGAAWLQLDEGDNDPARFLAYLMAALQTVAPGVSDAASALLQSPQSPPAESILTILINDIAGRQNDIILALDDYHTIGEPSVHRATAFLIDNLPPNLHVAIATRVDPPLPLARLRSRGELVEVRADDLRFTIEEVAAFFAMSRTPRLSSEDVAELEARTEGWIAGLHMLALCQRGQTDRGRLIHGVTGRHRHVFDFLMTEVFTRQAERVQAFLEQTSVLKLLCGPLCDAVTGQGDGQAMLEELETANLFTLPLDDERHWYRYHHLFAELLQARLQQDHPESIVELHSRAAQWYEGNGDIDAAVEHSLAGHDWPRATRLIEGHIRAYMSSGRLSTILGWIKSLPEEVVAASPRLGIEQAWALLFATRMQEMSALLRQIELVLAGQETAGARLAGPPMSDKEMNWMRSTLSLMQAYLTLSQGDARRAFELINSVARDAFDDTWWEHIFYYTMLGYASRAVGDLEAAADAFARAVPIARTGGNTFGVATALNHLAYTHRLRGRLGPAIECYREALRCGAASGTDHLPFLSQMQAGLAGVLLERNQVEEALRLARDAATQAEQWQSGNYIAWANLYLTQVLQATGDLAGAAEALRLADAARRSALVLPTVSAQVDYVQVRQWLAESNLAAAGRWAGELGWPVGDGSDAAEPLDEAYELRLIALARVLLTRGAARKPGVAAPGDPLSEALRLLRHLETSAQAAGRISALIEVLVLQVVALYEVASSQRPPGAAAPQAALPSALEVLRRVLVLAQPEGFVRVFVGEGESMAVLLRDIAARQTPVASYAARLLLELPVGPGRRIAEQGQALVEPLTEREGEVLRLLAAGLSNREMAGKLYVTEGTVKTHVHNLLAKLDADSRTHALARARELNLL